MMFKPFFGFSQAVRSELKRTREKMNRGDLGKTLGNMFITSCMQNPGKITTDALTIVLESVHYLLDHRVYYVSSNLARNLAQTDIELDLEAMGKMNLPSKLFEVCFEEDLEVDGHKIPSLLVVASTTGVVRSSMNEFIRRNAKQMIKEINFARKETGLPEIEHDFPEITQDRFRIDYSINNTLYHCVLPLDEGIYQGKPISEIVESLKVIAGTEQVNRIEKEMQKILTKVVLGLICYLNTTEPDITQIKSHGRPAIGTVRPNCVLLGKKETEQSWHLRKGHWRFLKHERFKRKEDGTIKTIWIRPSEVNRGNEPSEPEEKQTIIS